MDSRVIAELVLHLGRITSGDGLVDGLMPGQWAILRYLASANRFSRTPSAFAAFHGTTRGTVSQTIKSLVAQGYLKQTRSRTDGRSVRLDLTNKARAIIANDSPRSPGAGRGCASPRRPRPFFQWSSAPIGARRLGDKQAAFRNVQHLRTFRGRRLL